MDDSEGAAPLAVELPLEVDERDTDVVNLEVDDEGGENVDRGVVALRVEMDGRTVANVPTVIVAKVVSVLSDVDVADGTGMLAVAESNGDEKEPDIWSSLWRY